METSSIPSIQDKVEALAEQQKSRLPPEAAARFQERRDKLTATNLSAQALQRGEAAPDFTLPDAYDKPVTLSKLLKHGPVVLTFYRGDWCPYCNITLRAYQAILPEIAELRGTLVAVSPQDPDHTLLTVENKELSYPVLSDAGNQVARQYRLVWTIPPENRNPGVQLPEYNRDDSWTLPMAGTFVIDQDGVVQLAFVKEDWTKRLEPDAILGMLRQLS